MNESSDIRTFDQATPVPMTFGQILDRTYRLMRKHYRLFLGIAAVPAACFLTVMAAAIGVGLAAYERVAARVPPGTTVSFTPNYFLDHFMWVILCFYPIMIAAYALYLPAAVYAAMQADRGVVVSFRQAYDVAWSRFGRSLWLIVLCLLILIVPVAVIAGLIGAGAALMSHGAMVGSGPAYAFFLIPLLVLLYLGILVYSVLIMLRFAVAYPACIEENLSAGKALKRSASLTSGAMGRIFLVLLVVYAVVYAAEIVSILVFIALASVVAFIAMSLHVTVGSATFFTLVGVGVCGYLVAIGACILLSYAGFTTALAVLYHDQRLRKDVVPPVTPLA